MREPCWIEVMAKGQALMVQLSLDFSFSVREGKGDRSTGDTTRLQSPAVPTMAAESRAKKPSTPSRVMVPFSGMTGRLAREGKLASH